MFGELDLDKAFTELTPLIDDAKQMVDCLDQWTRAIQQRMRQTILSKWERDTMYEDGNPLLLSALADGNHHMVDKSRGVYRELYLLVKDGTVKEQYKSHDHDSVQYKYNDVSWSVDNLGRLKTLHETNKYYISRFQRGKLKKLTFENE